MYDGALTSRSLCRARTGTGRYLQCCPVLPGQAAGCRCCGRGCRPQENTRRPQDSRLLLPARSWREAAQVVLVQTAAIDQKDAFRLTDALAGQADHALQMPSLASGVVTNDHQVTSCYTQIRSTSSTHEQAVARRKRSGSCCGLGRRTARHSTSVESPGNFCKVPRARSDARGQSVSVGG